MLSPSGADEGLEAAQARVGRLLESRAGVIVRLQDELEKGRGETDERLHFPTPAAVELHNQLTALEAGIQRLLGRHKELEDEDLELDFSGRPGILAVGDVVYMPDGKACEVRSAELGRSAVHGGRLCVMYEVGKPDLKTLPFGVDSLTGSKRVTMPSLSLKSEPPAAEPARPRPRKQASPAAPPPPPPPPAAAREGK